MKMKWNTERLRALLAEYINDCLADFFREHPSSCALNEPQTVQKFAREFNFHPQATERYLMALAHLGLVEKKENRFKKAGRDVSVSENLSSFLNAFRSFQACRNPNVTSWLKTGDDSNLTEFYHFAEQFGSDNRWLAKYYILIVNQYLQAEAIEGCLKTNKPQTGIAVKISSQQIFDYYQRSPHILEAYAEGFAATNGSNNRVLAEQLPIQPGDRLIDVGGGCGSFAVTVSQVHPNMSEIVVYDLPESSEDLKDSKQRWSKRAKVPVRSMSGSFFKVGDHLEGVPVAEKFEWIALGWVLHDWNDEDCIAILKRARVHLKPGGKILILEKIMDPKKGNRAAVLDFLMLLMANGSERTFEGYDRLISAAQLRIAATYISATGRDLIVVEDSI